mgnify:CR=1 FL=1
MGASRQCTVTGGLNLELLTKIYFRFYNFLTVFGYHLAIFEYISISSANFSKRFLRNRGDSFLHFCKKPRVTNRQG